MPLPLEYRCPSRNNNHIKPIYLEMATIPLGDLLCVLVSWAKVPSCGPFFFDSDTDQTFHRIIEISMQWRFFVCFVIVRERETM